jgi:hypothetical protein
MVSHTAVDVTPGLETVAAPAQTAAARHRAGTHAARRAISARICEYRRGRMAKVPFLSILEEGMEAMISGGYPG